MPPKRRRSGRLKSRDPERPESRSPERSETYSFHTGEKNTSANDPKRRRTEPKDDVPAVLSTTTSLNDNTLSTISSTEPEEHEVLIMLGAFTMRIRRQQLRDAFGYFRSFTPEEFPKQFSLLSKADPEDWSSWWLLHSEVSWLPFVS
ncbi:hypothetical protein MPH_09000 [Macrophomina phaseolina MS6]|uniref:Uncharacterized protein n=1 Tax=Macrophomina phaseolina (strain MS6) TaxID=1126212 RepID=K2RUD5_MACPH|nr:hypothetical protein MPH_09000 [Macrophomina phaseolina MS6]